MANGEHVQHTSVSPPLASPTMILAAIGVSGLLVGLALLIQSDSQLIPIIQRALARLWPARIDYDSWQKAIPSPNRAMPSSSSNKGRKGGKQTSKRRNNSSHPRPSPPQPILSSPPSSRRGPPTAAPALPSSPTTPKQQQQQAHPSSSVVHPAKPSPTRAKKLGPDDAAIGQPTTPTTPTPAARPPPPHPPVSLNPRAAAYEFRAQYSGLPPAAAPEALLPSPEILAPSIATTAAQLQLQSSPYDAFLVLDVEATCAPGSTFDYPNEIIEWPVVLMRWKDAESEGEEPSLVVVDEFRSFVKPTWRPQLTDFCTSLTGISQTDIDQAPTFPQMLASFELWLQNHDLIPPATALLTPPSSRCPSPAPDFSEELAPHPPQPTLLEPHFTGTSTTTDSAVFSPAMSTSSLYSSSSFAFSPRPSNRTSQSSFAGWKFPQSSAPEHVPESYYYENEWNEAAYVPSQTAAAAAGTPRFAWATDGPFDLRDFLVKQCFISRIAIPEYFLGDVIDVRKVVGSYVATGKQNSTSGRPFVRGHGKRPSLNIPSQLQALSLGNFSGQQHSGIDDARNICRILQALGAKGVPLEANTYVNPNRRWYWMGVDGVVFPPGLPTPP